MFVRVCVVGWGEGEGDGGRHRTIMPQHLFSLWRMASETWDTIDRQRRLPWGDLITYKFMKEELFAVLTCTLCIYNIMSGPGKEAAPPV